MNAELTEYLENVRDEYLSKPQNESSYSSDKIVELFKASKKILHKLEKIRVNESATKVLIKEALSGYWNIDKQLLETWLVQVTEIDDTYVHAYNILAQKTNREMGMEVCKIKDISRIELMRLLREENNKDEQVEYEDINLLTSKKISRGRHNVRETTGKLIFSKDETLEKLFSDLKIFFPNHEDDFYRMLRGERLNNRLLFPNKQNKYVEVFRRLKYNGHILNNSTEICNWLCANFDFTYKRGNLAEIRPFGKNAVWDILTSGKGEPLLDKRIPIDWLPYKPKSLVKAEKQNQLID